MDVARLRKQDLKVWLQMMDGVEVLCRHLTQKEFDTIGDLAAVVRFDPRTHRRIEERDDAKFRSELARAVVQDWTGIDDAGKPYPCTPENIEYLMEHCTEFRLLVMDAPLSLEKMLAAEQAAAEKNSVTTSAPAPTIPA